MKTSSQSYDRVRQHTAPYINERIDLLTHAQIEKISGQGREAMERRIAELDQEWDIDRALMLNFAVIGGATFRVGTSGKKGWLYLFTSQIFFMGLHAVVGWCPPAVVFRRMGFRTRNEIEAEKQELLKILDRASAA